MSSDVQHCGVPSVIIGPLQDLNMATGLQGPLVFCERWLKTTYSAHYYQHILTLMCFIWILFFIIIGPVLCCCAVNPTKTKPVSNHPHYVLMYKQTMNQSIIGYPWQVSSITLHSLVLVLVHLLLFLDVSHTVIWFGALWFCNDSITSHNACSRSTSAYVPNKQVMFICDL